MERHRVPVSRKKMRLVTGKRTRTCEYSDINEALHEWYLLACSKNIYPVGLQLCKKAKQIAERLQKPEFKES